MNFLIKIKEIRNILKILKVYSILISQNILKSTNYGVFCNTITSTTWTNTLDRDNI